MLLLMDPNPEFHSNEHLYQYQYQGIYSIDRIIYNITHGRRERRLII